MGHNGMKFFSEGVILFAEFICIFTRYLCNICTIKIKEISRENQEIENNNFDSEMLRPIVLGAGLRKLPKSTNHDKIYLLFLWRQKEKWFLRRNRVAKIDQQRRKPQSKYVPSPA